MDSPTLQIGTRPSPRHSAAIALVAVFAASLLIALLQGQKTFYYDSRVYWLLSDTFVADGHFSLLNFENTGLRGYALPLTYFAVHQLFGLLTSDKAVTVMVFNAGIFAAVGVVLAPGLARITWLGQRWQLGRLLAMSGLILLFWRGYLNFPLSDFPALAAALLALIAISSLDSPLWMLTAGLAAGYSLNARPAYLLLTPILGVLIFYGWFEQRHTEHASRARRAVCLGLFVAGLACISVPQSIVQHRAFGSYNPIPGGNGLAGFQYTAGLELQRYETYVGNSLLTPRMEYLDSHTGGILDSLDDRRVSGTSEYAEIVLSHPLTMAGVFLRHIVNGLDERYTTPYVERLESPSHRLLRFAGFLLVFLALLRVAWPSARRGLGQARWRYPAALLTTCATSIPSAIETRFLLPVFVLCSLLVLAPGWPNPIESAEVGLRRYRALAWMIAGGALFFIAVWAIVHQTTDSLRLA